MRALFFSLVLLLAATAHAFIFFPADWSAVESAAYHADNIDNGAGTNVVLSGFFQSPGHCYFGYVNVGDDYNDGILLSANNTNTTDGLTLLYDANDALHWTLGNFQLDQGVFIGDGAGLTNLAANKLVGTITNTINSSSINSAGNIGAGGSYLGYNTIIANALQCVNLVVSGTYSGNGAGLTNQCYPIDSFGAGPSTPLSVPAAWSMSRNGALSGSTIYLVNWAEVNLRGFYLAGMSANVCGVLPVTTNIVMNFCTNGGPVIGYSLICTNGQSFTTNFATPLYVPAATFYSMQVVNSAAWPNGITVKIYAR